jgi:hypothetical protein
MTPAEEDQLLVEAITVAMDMRENLRDAHLRLRQMDRLHLEQVCCVLAAMVDPDVKLPVMAWWRALGQEAA